jgi:hypothetical protein
MDWWFIALTIFGLVAIVIVAGIAFVLLEAAFSGWAQADIDGHDDYDSLDDLDDIFRKKNYGD